MFDAPHTIVPLYFFSSIFPLVSVILCWCLFYGLRHFTPGHVLTISQTVAPFPECRVFAVTMCIESCAIFVLMSIRNSVFIAQANESGLSTARRYPLYKNSMWILSIGAPVGLLILSVVTVSNQIAVHLLGAFLFFLCSGIYFLLGDFALRFACVRMSIISWVATWLMIGLCALYAVFQMTSNSLAMSNTGAIFQYFAALALFAKLFLFQYDYPPHGVVVGSLAQL